MRWLRGCVCQVWWAAVSLSSAAPVPRSGRSIMNADQPSSSLQTRTRTPDRIPFPLALGGIGLILTITVPGGLTGGQGFFLGLLLGAAISILPAVVAFARDMPAPLSRVVGCAHWPYCGVAVSLTKASDGRWASTDERIPAGPEPSRPGRYAKIPCPATG